MFSKTGFHIPHSISQDDLYRSSSDFLEVSDSAEKLILSCAPAIAKKKTDRDLEKRLSTSLREFSLKIGKSVLSKIELERIRKIGEGIFDIHIHGDQQVFVDFSFLDLITVRRFPEKGVAQIKLIIENPTSSHKHSFSAKIRPFAKGSEAEIFELFSIGIPAQGEQVIRIPIERKNTLKEAEKYSCIETKLSPFREHCPGKELTGIMPPTKRVKVVHQTKEKYDSCMGILMPQGEGDLQEIVSREPPGKYITPPKRIWLADMMLQICDAAALFLQIGYIPGDIKLENIVVSKFRTVAWLIDYGGMTPLGARLESWTADHFTKEYESVITRAPLNEEFGKRICGYLLLVTFLSGLYGGAVGGKDFFNNRGVFEEKFLNEWKRELGITQELALSIQSVLRSVYLFPTIDNAKDMIQTFKACMEEKIRKGKKERVPINIFNFNFSSAPRTSSGSLIDPD